METKKLSESYAVCSHKECLRSDQCKRFIGHYEEIKNPKCFVLITHTSECKLFDRKE